MLVKEQVESLYDYLSLNDSFLSLGVYVYRTKVEHK